MVESVIVASEPLTMHERGWTLVPRNHLLVVTSHRRTIVEPINIEIEGEGDVDDAFDGKKVVIERIGASVSAENPGAVGEISKCATGAARAAAASMSTSSSLALSPATKENMEL